MFFFYFLIRSPEKSRLNNTNNEKYNTNVVALNLFLFSFFNTNRKGLDKFSEYKMLGLESVTYQ